MPKPKTTILVVDDDIRMLRMIQVILESENYQVLLERSAEEAIKVIIDEKIDLIMLDVMMGGMDGYTACSRIRDFTSLPIIMVTAKGSNEEISRGLEAGADDYITKPFSSNVLLSRVKAVLRRIKRPENLASPVFKNGDLEVDLFRYYVSVQGRPVDLTGTEYRLLSYMIQNAGRMLTSDQILEAVWGEEYLGEDRLVRVNIARLRTKLGDDAKSPKYIVTRVGIGYMFTTPNNL